MGDLTHTPRGQGRIWSHFQNAAPEIFKDSHPRQEFLARRALGRDAPSGSSLAVLNIGVGDGYLERRLLELGCRVSSLDPDVDAVQRLRSSGVDAHAGSIDEIPFQDGHFGVVIASEVLEHLTHDQRRGGLQEISRVLHAGGWFLGTVPFREQLDLGTAVCPECGHTFHRWGHQAAFDLPAVAAMMPDGLRLVESRATAFVRLRGRGLRGFAKAVGRRLLARLGEPIAQPSIFFAAERV